MVAHPCPKLNSGWNLWYLITYPCRDMRETVSEGNPWPFYWHILTLIPAGITKHTHRIMWAEITSPFQKFDGCMFEVWKWVSNSISLGCYYLSMLRLRLIHVSKMDPWWRFLMSSIWSIILAFMSVPIVIINHIHNVHRVGLSRDK